MLKLTIISMPSQMPILKRGRLPVLLHMIIFAQIRVHMLMPMFTNIHISTPSIMRVLLLFCHQYDA